MTLTVFLCIIALVLAGVELVKSKGQNLLAWAIGCVALALTLPLFRGM
jgi:hypothetical protein